MKILTPPPRQGAQAWRSDVAERSPTTSREEDGADDTGAQNAAARGSAAPAGLVICPITDRKSLTSGNVEVPDDLGELFSDSFPGRVELEAATAWGSWEWDELPGSVPMLEVSPGLVRLTAPDLYRAEIQANAVADRIPVLDLGDQEDDDGTRGEIRGWSRKSRSRMIARLATLDYEPLLGRVEQPAMVTLTYPGEWEQVAPDGETVKKHLQTFFKRYARAWGEDWLGIWKLEFQRRGAPHFHLFQAIPQGKAGEWRTTSGTRGRRMIGEGLTFSAWLSVVWADIVGAVGEEYARHLSAGTGVDYAEGAKARDPRKLAQYFSKHGAYAAKEYQHEVPTLWQEAGKSVGRFWGYRGLSPLVTAVTITREESIRMARGLRGLGARSTRWNGVTRRVETTKAVRRERRPRRKVGRDGQIKQARDSSGALLWDEQGNPVDWVQYRWTTVPVRRMNGTALGGGYLCVENGARVAAELGRYRETCLIPGGGRPPVGMRGSVAERVSK